MQPLLAAFAREVHVSEDEMIDIVRRGVLPRVVDQRLGERGIETAPAAGPRRLLVGGVFVKGRG